MSTTAALEASEPPADLGAVEAEAEEALDGLDEPAEEAGPSRFKVRDPASADWALRKLAKVRARQEEVRALAARQREAVMAVVARHLAPVDEWEADQAERLGHEEAYFEGLLAEWHREVLAEDPRQRTVRLPHGELVARKAPDRFEVDEKEFLAWARQAVPALVRVREEPDRQALRRYFAGTRPGDELADPATGEILGCVRLVAGEVAYKAVTRRAV
jgi:hypothetical protein